MMPWYSPYVLAVFDVHRVLVDPGSTTDLLQLLAFNQMKLSTGMMNSASQIFSSFNGATTTTLGEVTLPIQVGQVT